MVLTVDWTGKLATPPYGARVTIPQADLNFISGTLWELDTDAFRLELKSLEDDEVGMPFHDTHVHTTEYTVAGTTYARAILMLSEVVFEDTGSAYSVRLAGSNNDIFDVDNGILIPTALVTIIAQNSAGLVVTDTSGLTVAESAALLLIDTNVDTLLTAQTLTNDQAVAERVTDPHTGKLVLRNITKMLRWEADAWEDDDQTIPYKGEGLESVGELVSVAWS